MITVATETLHVVAVDVHGERTRTGRAVVDSVVSSLIEIGGREPGSIRIVRQEASDILEDATPSPDAELVLEHSEQVLWIAIHLSSHSFVPKRFYRCWPHYDGTGLCGPAPSDTRLPGRPQCAPAWAREL